MNKIEKKKYKYTKINIYLAINYCYLKITYPVGIFQCIMGFIKISRGWTDATDHQGLSIPSKRILSEHIVNIRSVQAASQEDERRRE